MMRRRFSFPLSLLLLCACKGGGSDIGPKLTSLPDTDYRVLVQDDSNQPVTGALVSIAGLSSSGASGRTGRARIFARPSGVRLLTVDGAAASARDDDRLGSLTISASLPDGDELPFVLHLPDVAKSQGLTLSVGVLASTQTLDDSAQSGAIVVVAASTTVGGPASATSFVLRTGKLGIGHLPAAVPVVAGSSPLTSRAVYLDPPFATFAPGASLSLPNELGLAAAQKADLFHLDSTTGVWVKVGSGTVAAGGSRIEAPSGSVTEGGLYCFAIAVATRTTLTGRIVLANGAALSGALVQAPQAHARTASDGRFTLPAIATLDGAAAPRTVLAEINGGRDLAPVRTSKQVTLAAGSLDLGDIVLETAQVGTVQVLLVARGGADPGRRMRISASEGLASTISVGDERGVAVFEDIDVHGFFGLLTTRIQNVHRVFLAEAAGFFDNQTNRDLNLFGDQVDWWRKRGRGGQTRAVVVDKRGTGPIRFAAVMRGSTPGAGFLRLTQENGIVVADFNRDGTASIQTSHAGVSVFSAFTMKGIDSERIEMPLERVRRQPVGAFDRHGLVAGNLLGTLGGTRNRRVRSTRKITLSDWFDEVFFQEKVAGDAPVKENPAVTGGVAFVVGVPLPSGNIAGVEGSTSGGGFTLERLGFVSSLKPVEGARMLRDIDLNLTPSTSFVDRAALVGLDPSLTAADLSFSYGVELADGKLVDIVRGVTGNMAVSGQDVTFSLPALTGVLQGARQLLALEASHTAGGKTISQSIFVPFRSAGDATVSFLGVPDITSPAPGATVSGNAFTVDFVVPAGATYVQLQLRHESASEVRDWTVVLPPTETSFTFRQLPSPSTQILKSAATWTLKVTAARIETGFLSIRPDLYRRVLQNWVGLAEAEREVNGFASTTIQVSTN